MRILQVRCRAYLVRFLLGMAAAMLFFSCGRPPSEEYYAKTGETEVPGVYVFTVELGDSLSCYDLDVLTVLSCGERQFSSFEGFPVNAVWTSPSGIRYTEEFWISAGALESRRHYSKRFYVPYREGLVPKEFGTWVLSLAVSPYFIREYSIPGLGIKMTRKPWGTEN